MREKTDWLPVFGNSDFLREKKIVYFFAVRFHKFFNES